MSKDVAVIGAGSWGTALAAVCADNGHRVTLWVRNQQLAEEINTRHTNRKYLPEAELPTGIRACSDLAEAVSDKRYVLLVTPSHAMREVVRSLAPHLREDVRLIHATKGLEVHTLKRMSEVIAEEVEEATARRIVVLTGPSHAEEVIRRSPTTVVVSSASGEAMMEAQDLLMNNHFRVYTNPDMVGAEIAGSLKNIIALGAGLSDGVGFGDNAKAALLTRGLAEIARLGVKLGANQLTFAGLAGVGDLVVTCTSKHSRNWRAGFLLGQGKSLEETLRDLGMVVEGVKTTSAAKELAERENVDMPITAALYSVMFEGKSVRQAVEDLMGRGRTFEMEEIMKHR